MQTEAVEESQEEWARWEPKPPLDMGDEHHPFPGFRGRLDLSAGSSAFNTVGDPPGSPQPGELGLGHLGPFPSGALIFLGIVV